MGGFNLYVAAGELRERERSVEFMFYEMKFSIAKRAAEWDSK